MVAGVSIKCNLSCKTLIILIQFHFTFSLTGILQGFNFKHYQLITNFYQFLKIRNPPKHAKFLIAIRCLSFLAPIIANV